MCKRESEVKLRRKTSIFGIFIVSSTTKSLQKFDGMFSNKLFSCCVALRSTFFSLPLLEDGTER